MGHWHFRSSCFWRFDWQCFSLLRNSSGFYLFIASLPGVIVSVIHTLGVGIAFGLGEIFGIIVMPLVLAVFLSGMRGMLRARAG